MSEKAPTTATAVGADAKPRSSREDVLQFLDSLDSYSTPPRPSGAPSDPPTRGNPPSTTSAPPANAEEAQSVLDFLDEITQRSSTPTAQVKADLAKKAGVYPGGSLSRSGSKTNIGSAPPAGGANVAGSRRSGESARSKSSTPARPEDLPVQAVGSVDPAPADGGWGWSSVWSQASNVVQQASQVVQQARTVAEEQVKTASGGAGIGGLVGAGGEYLKALGENEQAKKWSEGVIEYARGAHLDQIGKDLKSTTLRSLTDLLNAVAPPIAEHEVIKVSLSHDMVGYDGVETLVYRGLAKVMDQVEGGSLIVNKGNEAKPKEDSADSEERKLNAVEGLAEGWKLAEANLDELIKQSFVSPTPEEVAQAHAQSLTVPITTCPIYMRIQPCLAPLPFYTPTPSATSDAPTSATEGKPQLSLFFLLLLRDPTHHIVQTTLSQSIPAPWLDIPFEENEWVEDAMVDVIRRSVEIIGQQYISHRMRAQTDAINQAREAAQLTLSSQAAGVAQAVEPQDEKPVEGVPVAAP